MSNKKGISIKDYFNAPSSITQPTAEPSNEVLVIPTCRHPVKRPMTSNNHRCQKTKVITPIAVMSSQKPSWKQKRSCKHDWFKQFSWLDFNAFDDSVTCYVCKRQNNQHNLKTERCKENSFLEKGFKNWEKALEIFEKHHSSQCHRAASTCEILILRCPDIVELFDIN